VSEAEKTDTWLLNTSLSLQPT